MTLSNAVPEDAGMRGQHFSSDTLCSDFYPGLLCPVEWQRVYCLIYLLLKTEVAELHGKLLGWCLHCSYFLGGSQSKGVTPFPPHQCEPRPHHHITKCQAY